MRAAIAMAKSGQSGINPKRLALATMIICGLTIPSQADLYRYRDHNGRLVISSTPPPAGVDTVTTVPEHKGASMETTVPTMIQKTKRAKAPKAARRKPEKRQRQKQKQPPTSKPVSTHQFGLLRLGSSQAEIKRLLGPPAKRTTHGKKTRMVRLRGRFEKRKVRLETWHYPGTSRILPTQLTFYDGVLAEKDKTP
jgi:hypothetical protein